MNYPGKWLESVATRPRQFLYDEDETEAILDELDSEMESQHNELISVSRAIDDTNRRLERLYEAIETGRLGLDDLAIRIKELRQRQEQLLTQRIEIENLMSDRKVGLVNLETMTEYIVDMQAVLREGTLVERKAFIRSFVNDIRVSGDDAVLSYSIPELSEKISFEEVGVPRIIQRGGRCRTRTCDILCVKHLCKKAEAACLL
jgi:DNA repair ATPase RecN